MAFHHTYARIYIGTKLIWKVQFGGLFSCLKTLCSCFADQVQRSATEKCQTGGYFFEKPGGGTKKEGFFAVNFMEGIHILQVKVRFFLLSQQKQSHKVTLAQH